MTVSSRCQTFIVLLHLILVGAPSLHAQIDTVQFHHIRDFRADDRVMKVAFSPDGKLLAAGTNGRVLVWNSQGDLLYTLVSRQATEPVADDPLHDPAPHTDWVSALGFSADGKLLAATCVESGLSAWDIATGATITEDHSTGGTALAFGPDNTSLAWAAGDRFGAGRAVHIRKLPSGDRAQDFTDFLYPVVALQFSSDGTALTVLEAARTGQKSRRGSSGRCRIWDLAQRVLESDNEVDDIDPANATLGVGGRVIAASGTIRLGWSIHLWDARTGQLVRDTASNPGIEQTRGIAFSRDNQVVAIIAGQTDGIEVPGQASKFWMWNVRTGESIWRYLGHGSVPGGGVLRSVALSPSGNTVAIGGSDRTVQIWSIR